MKKVIFISAMLLASFVLHSQDYVETLHNGSNGYINNVGVGNLDFQHEGVTKMSLTDGGRLGIGTTTPAQALHVRGRSRASFAGGLNEYVEIYHGGSHGFINTVGDGNLDFRHDGSTKMSLTSAGRLGIGTNAPTEALEVNGNIKLPDADPNTGSIYFGGLTDQSEVGMRLFGGDVLNGALPGGFIDVVADNAYSGLRFRVDQNNGSLERMRIRADGKVVIGNDNNINTPGDYKLYVDNGILTEKVKVATVNSADWADYVFDEDYKLNSTQEVESFIKENKHLPNVPSAQKVSENGVDMVEMDATLLRQIEELWLHTIKLNKRIQELEDQLNK